MLNCYWLPAFVFGEQYRRTGGILSLWSRDIGSDCEAGNPIREDGESPALMRGELSIRVVLSLRTVLLVRTVPSFMPSENSGMLNSQIGKIKLDHGILDPLFEWCQTSVGWTEYGLLCLWETKRTAFIKKRRLAYVLALGN